MGRVKLFAEKDGEAGVRSVCLAGNPNVGKSTLFNTVTGMHRHTGNWAGKTVDVAAADMMYGKEKFSIADIPGTYSLLSHSEEESIARDYICFGGADVTVVVCDATSLERSLGLALQIGEISGNFILCLNLIDEAERAGIKIDKEALGDILGVPVITTVARRCASRATLLSAVSDFFKCEGVRRPYRVRYPEKIFEATAIVESALAGSTCGGVSSLWLALRLIEGDETLTERIEKHLGGLSSELYAAICEARRLLFSYGIGESELRDVTVSALVDEASSIAEAVTTRAKTNKASVSEKIDRVLTGRFTAYPVMLIFLAVVFFTTFSLANYPSELLARLFTYIEGWLISFFGFINAPAWLSDCLVFGVYRTLAQVVAVMLPPMAIFFPMFTLLEDSGYLPRVAYNLDRPFACSGACGKQALTMCMGLGCNAVGISGARIIDSERERKLAILTNSFVPCNGRLPMLVTLSSVLFLFLRGRIPSLLVALLLLGFILLSVLMTFLVTALLSRTLLSGERSSFTIELPPYRRPEFLRVILRSLTTKTLSVLMRAVAVAAPMGLIIYLLSNIFIDGVSLIAYAADFFEPLGAIMGLDGVIILAFILGIPANEIVIPLMIMIYAGQGKMAGEVGILTIKEIFSQAGWSCGTALCASLFALFHWPCATTLITAYKETKSVKYTLLTFIIPTLVGFVFCVIVNLLFSILT